MLCACLIAHAHGSVGLPDDEFVIQAKVGAEPRVRAALSEVVAGAEPGQIPVVAVKWNRGRGKSETVAAVLPWSVWLEVIER